MCVAALINTKAGPTSDELYCMDDDNPHGAGIAWAAGDLIRYRKGLTWQQVRDALPHLPRPVLLHFRWATHGGRARYLSHPFPLGTKAVTSRKLNSAAKAVLIHNGTWDNYINHIPPGIDGRHWSDTAVAAYLAGTEGEHILDDVHWCTAVGRAAGNGRMDVTLRGHWDDHDGNLYSNLTWQWDYRRNLSDQLKLSGYYGYDPREPRWTGDGRLTYGSGVRIDGTTDLVDDVPDVVTWFEEHRAVQKVLEAREERRLSLVADEMEDL